MSPRDAAERYPLVIARIARRGLVRRETAARWFHEMLKFLDVCALSQETLAPSKRVDRAWHAFLLHTRDYSDYCEERFGRLLHHDPSERPDDAAYLRARAAVRDRFGSLDQRIWPKPGHAGGGAGAVCGGVGGGDGGGGSCGGGGCGGGSA